MNIHSRIRQLRLAKGLSMEALADLVGVSFQAVQQWEKPDGTAPTRKRTLKVAVALDTTVEYLMHGITQGPATPSLGAIDGLTPDEAKLIDALRNLPEHRLNLYRAQIIDESLQDDPPKRLKDRRAG